MTRASAALWAESWKQLGRVRAMIGVQAGFAVGCVIVGAVTRTAWWVYATTAANLSLGAFSFWWIRRSMRLANEAAGAARTLDALEGRGVSPQSWEEQTREAFERARRIGL